MGLGIESRHQRCRSYWSKHLEFCKKFQSEALTDIATKSASCTVLGAGRLLDLNVDLISKKSVLISLYDADPSCKSTWKATFKNFYGQTNFRIQDLTGILDEWTLELKDFLISNHPQDSALVNFLANLKLKSAPQLEASDIVISLNILSQIPVYWRDRVHSLVKNYWSIITNPDGCYASKRLQEALEATFRLLQEQHLELLSNSQSKKIILITDEEWFYYTQDQSEWQSEQALWFGPDLKNYLAKQLPNYKTTKNESWLWHLAPQFVEQADYGVIHRVQAFALDRLLDK